MPRQYTNFYDDSDGKEDAAMPVWAIAILVGILAFVAFAALVRNVRPLRGLLLKGRSDTVKYIAYLLFMNPNYKKSESGSSYSSDAAAREMAKKEEEHLLAVGRSARKAMINGLKYVHSSKQTNDDEADADCSHYFATHGQNPENFSVGAGLGKTHSQQRCDAIKRRIEKHGGIGWKQGFFIFASRHKG